MNNDHRLPIHVKIAYSSAEGALSIVYTIIYMIGMFFFTDIAGLSPSIAGAIMMTGTIFNAIFDPLAGMLSDRVTTPLGRRRAFLLFSAVPYGITAIFLFTDFNFASPYREIYYFIIITVFFWFFSAINVPYSSLSAEMTSSYDERTSLLGWRAGVSQLGSLIGAGLPLLLVSFFTAKLLSRNAAWSAMGTCFGLLCIPLILTTWRFTRGYETYFLKNESSFRKSLSGITSNTSLLMTIGMYTFGLMAVTATGSISIYYMTCYLGFNDLQVSLYLAILFGGNVIWVPAIGIISKKLSKRHAYLIFGTVWAVCQMSIYAFINPAHHIFFLILLLIGSSGLIAVFMIGWAMIPDCVDVDEYRTGKRREGLFFGTMFFIQKAFCAFLLFLIGLLLSGIGYVANSIQTEETIDAIRMIMGPGIVSLIVISILFCYRIPLTRKRHQLIRNALMHDNSNNSSTREELSKL